MSDDFLLETDGARTSRSTSTQQHRAEAPDSVRCTVITVSDTRTLETDRGGALIEELLLEAGHQVLERRIVTDDVEAIRSAALQVLARGPEAVVVTGGSGIGPRDVSPEALKPLISKELPGFGELFRVLSWEEVGAATMLSRAFAGVIERHQKGEATRRCLLFVLPGSTNAARLAMEKLIVPELGHLIREIAPR
jgi:molybdenum cofactor biosynthesis protein B